MSKKPIFEKKNVLVTGGAGFIGSHLCDELVRTSKVLCIDNFISGSENNIDHLLQNPDFEFIKHDMTQPLDLEKIPEGQKFKVQFQGIQEVYHLACPTLPNHFEKTVVETALANSLGTKNALDIALKYNAKFLLASSAVVYGPRDKKNIYFNETKLGCVDNLSPRACYDEGKRFAESLTQTYHSAYNLDTKIARIFRTYGPRMKLKTGQMLPDFVYNALENTDLVIFGDKSFSSSLCYIADMVQGLMKLMASGQNNPINLGSDEEVKISDVAQQVIDLTNSQSKIAFQDPLLFMSPLGLPDITRAKEQLSWFPIVRLKQGLTESIDYFKAYKTILEPGTIL